MLDHRHAAYAAGIEKLSDVSHRRVGFDAHHFGRHHIGGGQHGSLLSIMRSEARRCRSGLRLLGSKGGIWVVAVRLMIPPDLVQQLRPTEDSASSPRAAHRKAPTQVTR